MHQLTRVLLIVAVAAFAWSAGALVMFFWPSSAIALVIVAMVRAARRGHGRLTTLGSARWADEADLRRQGMLGASTGLILGRLPDDLRSGLAQRVRALGTSTIPAVLACRFFLAGLKRNSPDLVRLPQIVHLAVFGPTGGGKGASCIIPWLLTVNESAVVVDFKGENALRTAEFRRRKFGHKIVLLDPFHVVTKTPATFNPLDFIEKDNPRSLDECNDLAKALVIRTAEERDPHWNDSAEAWIAAIIATVVYYGGDYDSRSLQTVHDLLSNPQRLDTAVKLMCESECWSGMLARLGGQLSYYIEKEKSSTLTTVARHLRFLATPAVAASTAKSSFDPAELQSGKMTVYLIIPPEHMRAQAALLRMWIGSLLRANVRGGLQETKRVHYLIDEAASVGHLEPLDDAVDKYRGYGVRLQLYYQSLGQLKKCFPEGQEQTLLSNATQIYFGVNDNLTAEYVSARLGEGTIVVDSGGTSDGSSFQSSESAQGSNSHSRSHNRNYNWAPQARKLLKPEEIMAMPPRTAITFTLGVAPVRTTLLRYYEERKLPRPANWLGNWAEASRSLLVAALLCVLAIGGAVAITATIQEHQRQIAPPRDVLKPQGRINQWR